MSVFKQFLSSDLIVTPFGVNKNFTFSGSEFTTSYAGIDRFIGTNIAGLFSLVSDPITGFINSGSYQRLIYNSIKELYYSNYLSSSLGSEATLTIDVNGVLIQANNQQPSYENYLQSTLTSSRYIPTGSNNQIGVISIPTTLFGEQIRPSSFNMISLSGSISDDGEGNIIYTSSSININVGDIIYSHGVIVLTNSTYSSSLINGFINQSTVTMSFASTYTRHETQYKCNIHENEFNLSYNPSLLSGSTVYEYATGSFFSPYITTVGLYNDNQELLAVAKLAKPLLSSNTTDMNIIINLDR